MSRITRIEVMNVDLKAKVARSDAIQSFSKQETPIVRVHTSDGLEGTGYAYTIGNGASAILAMIRDCLGPWLIGRDAEQIEENWKGMFLLVHANAVGPTASLALAALDTALWDLRCKRASLPLHVMAGGAQQRVPVYNTEGGWLNFTTDELVSHAAQAREAGFRGFKVKVGRASASEDVQRLRAVREALGAEMELMTDANQIFDVPEAIRRARHFEELDVAWFEEPLPAEDLGGHIRLSASTSLPIAIGESVYHLSHFREYLQRDACSVVQVDVARIGGITPWLKVAHLAEAFNVPVNPHYLMELHVSLCAAVPNSKWVEYIPQLDDITTTRIQIVDGYAAPPSEPGNGINWNWEAIERMRVSYAVVGGR